MNQEQPRYWECVKPAWAKTAIVLKALAQRIINGEVPDGLPVEQAPALSCGHGLPIDRWRKFRAEFEERLKGPVLQRTCKADSGGNPVYRRIAYHVAPAGTKASNGCRQHAQDRCPGAREAALRRPPT